jgi:hypothetical protein
MSRYHIAGHGRNGEEKIYTPRRISLISALKYIEDMEKNKYSRMMVMKDDYELVAVFAWSAISKKWEIVSKFNNFDELLAAEIIDQ